MEAWVNRKIFSPAVSALSHNFNVEGSRGATKYELIITSKGDETELNSLLDLLSKEELEGNPQFQLDTNFLGHLIIKVKYPLNYGQSKYPTEDNTNPAKEELEATIERLFRQG